MVLRKKSLIKRGAEALARTASSAADRFVHDEAQDRALQARCIAVAGGLSGACLCAVPPTLALAADPLPTAAALGAAGIVAGASAIAISRTGRLAGAQHVATLAVQGAVTALATLSGGLASPLVALLPVLPFVSAMRLDRPLLRTALGASGAGVAWLAISPATRIVPHEMAAVGVGLAFAALALIALAARGRTSKIIEDAKRIDAVLQQRTGAHILSHAVGAQALGEADLQLDRLHVQDRVAFHKAVSDVAHLGADIDLCVRLSHHVDGTLEWRTFDVRLTAAGERVASVWVPAAAEIEANPSGGASGKRFLATMSHELRTPLNAVIGFSDMLAQQVHGPLPHPKQREYVELIRESGAHLLGVVNSLLDVSRLDAGRYDIDPVRFDPTQEARAALGMMQGLADAAGITLTLDAIDAPETVTADSRAVRQVLINLLSNAVKFTPEGGTVTLRLAARDKQLQMDVRDTGIGIAAEDIARLGEPFFQLDDGTARRFGGSGLGLSVVRGLVDLHGGDFEIESAPGEGTRVRVSLPIAATLRSATVPSDMQAGVVHLPAVATARRPHSLEAAGSKRPAATADTALPSRVSQGESHARYQA